MLRLLIREALLTVSGVIVSATAAAEPQQLPQRDVTPPNWIWHRDTSNNVGLRSGDHDGCWMERRFAVAQPIQSATLRVAADFCAAAVSINSHPLLTMEAFSPTVDLDVSQAIKPGENRLQVTAQAVPGPAAIALSLTVVAMDGARNSVVTDNRWMAAASDGKRAALEQSASDRQPAAMMGQVAAGLWGLNRRPATIDPFDNYGQWRQALGAKAADRQPAFWTAPGFEISLIREAHAEEGSWVSMAFDPRGRITIAREDKGLLRMTMDATRRSVSQVETINADLEECRGLLYAYDALYANANNSKALYRLRDTDSDGRFDEVRLLREFPGNVGHGRNDLALGPDGLIYSIHGDAVDVPTRDVIDYTSPFRESRRRQTIHEGHVLRTDRDGKQWELLCAGLRNPFGIAFNELGDCFTYDADAEFDMGTPWYRTTRIVQLVRGADYGWRGVTGKWPPYYPDHADNATPTLDIGKGSPTAVVFGTGTHFPADYRRALFVLDWAYGRILAVHLAPRGAGYRGWAETFLKGRPLNVTDVAVGPDGALWVITGGRKTQSALYRIAYVGDDTDERWPSLHEEACQKFADAARRLRIELESRHRPEEQGTVDFAWPHLDSPDPVIRYAARTAVEHQPVKSWRQRALDEQRPTASLTALAALARSGDKETSGALLDRLLSFPARDLTVGQPFFLVQGYSVCQASVPQGISARRDPIVAQLDAIFPYRAAEGLAVSQIGTSANLNRELARSLAELGSPTIVEKTVRWLLTSSAQEDRLQGLFVLRNIAQGWTDETRRLYFSALNDANAFVGGEGMPKFLSQIREQAIATLTGGERASLADLLAPPQMSSDEPLPPPRPFVRRWTMEDLPELFPASARQGDPGRGAAIFGAALCARCHRAGARGPAVGPDLTHVAGRFSQRDNLESILAPSKVVAENYRNVQITTTDGRQIVGRVVLEGDFRSEKLRIATQPLHPAEVIELSKSDMEQVRESEISPMPAGLLDSFTAAEIRDLLAFLHSGAP